MKKDFFDILDKIMEKDESIHLIFCGLGYPRVDEFLTKYPGRAINTEASEQTALDIAVGLAYSGKVPFVYTITPFLYRAFETIRTYINHESLNVKLIGVGRGGEYSEHDGFSHFAGDIREILGTQKNIVQYYPNVKSELEEILNKTSVVLEPAFINIKR